MHLLCTCMQVAALKSKGRTGVRWHPLFVRWCLNLTHTSPKAYEIMRSSGVKLPMRRTLNDYTHWITAKAGVCMHRLCVMMRMPEKETGW